MFTIKQKEKQNGIDCWGRYEYINIYNVYNNGDFICSFNEIIRNNKLEFY